MNNEKCVVADHHCRIEGICSNKDCTAKQRLMCIHCTRTIHQLCKMNFYTHPELVNQLKERLQAITGRQQFKTVYSLPQLRLELVKFINIVDHAHNQLTNEEDQRIKQVAKIQQLLANSQNKEFFIEGYEIINSSPPYINLDKIVAQLEAIKKIIDDISSPKSIGTNLQIDNEKLKPLQAIKSATYRNQQEYQVTNQNIEIQPRIIDSKHAISSLALSIDGLNIASAGFNDFVIKVWSIQNGQLLKQFDGHTNHIYHVAYSPCGKYILSSSEDKSIRQWSTSTEEHGPSLDGHTSIVYQAYYTPDQKYIISCSTDNTVRVWDPITGSEYIKKRLSHKESIRSIAVSKSQLVAFGDLIGQIYLLDYLKDTIVQELNGHTKVVLSIQYSSNDKMIVSCSDELIIRIWELQNKKYIARQILEGHQGTYVYSVSFSPDMKYIVSSGNDSTVRIWSKTSGKQIGDSIKHEKGQIMSVQFYYDGKYLIIGSYDGNIEMKLAPIK